MEGVSLTTKANSLGGKEEDMAQRPSDPMISLTGFAAPSAGLLLIFFSMLPQAQAGGASGGEESYVPAQRVVYRTISPAAMAEAAAPYPYEPFEVCRRCRCCGSSPSNASSCVDMSCCYAINCNLPGKPFGTCAFAPKTCGCGAANNCTQPAS